MASSHPAFTPLRLRGAELPNRIVKTATFEGMCPRGEPSAALVEHHRRIAQGGSGTTTVAYCSVSPDGRTYDSQMLMGPDLVAPLGRLTESVHREGGLASIQLGHCGFFAEKRVIGSTPIGPSRVFNTYGLSFCRAMTESDIDRVARDFGQAAALSRESGFDMVELHFGHGYLVSQFLSPATNLRRDAFGGSLENRLRFPRMIVEEVRARVGDDYPIVIKINLRDGFEGGLELEEAIGVAKALEVAGVDALVLSGGFVSKTPLYMMRGDVPLKAMVAVQDRWIRKVGLTLFGKTFVQAYPFEPMYFFEDAKAIRAAVDMPLVLIGGITALDHVESAMDAGFELVAMGRALIHDPDLPSRWAKGERVRSGCVPCNECIAEMDRGGVRCTRT